MKKRVSILLAVFMIFQAGIVSVFADDPQTAEQPIYKGSDGPAPGTKVPGFFFLQKHR